MLVDLIDAIRQTKSLVLITYRPEYRGALARVPGCYLRSPWPRHEYRSDRGADRRGWARTTSVCRADGPDSGTSRRKSVLRSEIVRDLAERGVLEATAASYRVPR
jgi:adenylate cyclase